MEFRRRPAPVSPTAGQPLRPRANLAAAGYRRQPPNPAAISTAISCAITIIIPIPGIIAVAL